MNLQLFIPELILAGFALLVIILDLFIQWKGLLGAISLAGLVLAGGMTVAMWGGSYPALFNNMLAVDNFALFFKFLFLGIAFLVILASSDLSHKNVSGESDLKKFKSYDQEVLESFENNDPKKTLKACLNTTVCGPQTITTLLLTCQKLGANQGRALKYYTSHDITEKTSGYCVGYLSAILSK